MKPVVTKGIILSRTDYSEADRIITLLTPDQGKRRLMAKGVRKVKSKLAGGIELFSISDIAFIKGRGDIGTLTSARLDCHYAHIVKDIERVQLGYYLIRLINRATEDHTEAEYFELLAAAFKALDDIQVRDELIKLWFEAQLIKLAGHMPNLMTDLNNQPLAAEAKYNLDFSAMTLTRQSGGNLSADHIKTLRLLFSQHQPPVIQKVQGLEALLPPLRPLISAMLTSYIRV